MTIEGKIKQVAESMEVTYVFDNWSVANIRLDKLPLPAIINVLPASGELNFNNGNIRDCPNALFAFIDKIPVDARGSEKDDTIERMKSLAMRFFVAINKSGMFQPIGGRLPYRTIYDKLDIAVTGVMFELRIEEVSGICERTLK